MPEDYDSFDSQQRRKFWQTHIEQWQAKGFGGNWLTTNRTWEAWGRVSFLTSKTFSNLKIDPT